MRKAPCIKKVWTLLLSALLVFAALPAPAAMAASSDIAGHWAEDSLAKWSDLGWFTGDGAGTYRPNDGITRAEFAALVNRMKGYAGESADIANYKDVSPDKWYYGAISAALAAGYLTGVGADAMAPERPITRQEAIAIIARIEGVTASDTAVLSSAADGGDVAAWARESVAASVAAGLVSGSDGKLNPTANITRAESVVLMDRVYANIKTYALAGTYGPASGALSAAAVNIAGDGVRLRNATVSGDLTIAAAVGEGDVYLDGVKVNGALIVRGGGYGSVHLADCDVKELVVEKDGVRVVVSGASSVASVRSEGRGDAIEVADGAKIETLTLAAANTSVSLEAGAAVTTLNAEATGAKIETQAGAKIGTANLNAQAEITGAGSIATANINADGATIEAKPATTNVASGVTATVGGTTVGGGAAETVATPSGGGGGGGGGGGTTPLTATLANGGAFDVDGVNYVLLSVTAGNYANGSYSINGAAVSPSKVLADGSLIKLPVPAGADSAVLSVTQIGRTVLSDTVAFSAAGAPLPATLYGTVPMAFSEFFYDITANINTIEPAETAFAANGTVAEPVKFITQGTRTGSLTYAAGDLLPKVDVISSATYGDNTHFVPEGNLTLDSSDRKTTTDPNAAIMGIKKVEVGVSFDLYANATLLAATNKATAQSTNVLAKTAALDVTAIRWTDGAYTDENGASIAAPPVYKPKYLLIDGNWGKRAETALNAAAVRPLPGTEIDVEDVAYGGNWGDKVTGVTFEDLEDEYKGANYWDNFGEYLYGGYIEDSTGHREPLVFLQNIFTHRMHEDFDIAVSPSRFARLKNLKTPDTYTVHVYAYGFADIEASFYMKDYVNGGAEAISGGPSFTYNGAPISITVSNVANPAAYAANTKIYKGETTVSESNYTVASGAVSVVVTFDVGFFTGSYQGAYTLQYETAAEHSKTLSFTLVNPTRPQLTLNVDRTTGGVDPDTSPAAITVTKNDKVYFTNDEFAAALVTSGRNVASATNIKEADSATDAVAIGAAVARTGEGQPYYLDLSATVFEAGKTYAITTISTGFAQQIYYIRVIP